MMIGGGGGGDANAPCCRTTVTSIFGTVLPSAGTTVFKYIHRNTMGITSRMSAPATTCIIFVVAMGGEMGILSSPAPLFGLMEGGGCNIFFFFYMGHENWTLLTRTAERAVRSMVWAASAAPPATAASGRAAFTAL